MFTVRDQALSAPYHLRTRHEADHPREAGRRGHPASHPEAFQLGITRLLQSGCDGSQQPIQLPRQGSQGVGILRLVGVSYTGLQGIHVGQAGRI